MDTAGKAVNARLDALIDSTGTWGIKDDAIKNLLHGRPAFWGSQGRGNDPASLLMASSNRLDSIKAAQDELADHFRRNGRDVYSAEWLDYLLPLNNAAVRDLKAAYERARTFRTTAELERRTERFEASPQVAA